MEANAGHAAAVAAAVAASAGLDNNRKQQPVTRKYISFF